MSCSPQICVHRTSVTCLAAALRGPQSETGPTTPDGQTLGATKVYTLDLPETWYTPPSSCTHLASREMLYKEKNILILREMPLWYNPERNRFWLLAAARPHAPATARRWLLFLRRFSQSNFIHFMERMDWHQPSAELEGTLLESAPLPVKTAASLPRCPTSALKAQFVEPLGLKKHTEWNRNK